jgi:hypothetical protein
MTIDLAAATRFMTAHARLLDRRRFDVLLGNDDPARIFDAVEGYANADGGYGWGLEPDLRSPESQPAGALHAFEAFADAAPATSPRSRALCDWLLGATRPDGGLPFALPLRVPEGSAPFWAGADPDASSLQITAVVAAEAHRVAVHDAAVARHPWLEAATGYCVRQIEALETAPPPMTLAFAVRFLDAAYDAEPRAGELLERLGPFVPGDGLLQVAGGREDEFMRPLDFAPFRGRPARGLLSEDAVASDLERLAGGQRPDGGWTVDFDSYSPAAALEWRGHATVHALVLLRHNGML